ncbi:hypothetical protein JAAARDRAFT_133460 [Jaapia argillacea MUCL 33604]|uniref:Uncharacterized protein n=1 Tax=Jaapia argillacea MUCL 33604 TaxID=933084 RepID=A0A067PWM2_9AGAM|nr:hypothetical protein JAAARDRAFT_133460 [Jaapia argillacea MUCL 33604]
MVDRDDALKFAGWEGCAADREFYWHLGSDTPEQWDRFPNVSSWSWTPEEGCDVRPLHNGQFVRDLVETGGWLLLGDSMTENHFFSLSCILYPHVIATPNYTENPYYDRAWAQHLYLSPSSPLVSALSFPPGFDITITPLVTFRRIDLLLSQPELVGLHHKLHADEESLTDNYTLFSDETTWNMSPSEYMPIFLAPLPEANYGTLIVSTGGHWTTTLFQGYRDESLTSSGYGILNLLSFFRESMDLFASMVQKAINEDRVRQAVQAKGAGRRVVERKVVARAYLPGHEDCHSWREPWSVYKPFVWNWYNWAWIGDFNRVFEEVLSKPDYPNVHFLPIDTPALLRPDAHATGDCLHIMTGTGVMEGWSHYIWHFVTKELPAKYGM